MKIQATICARNELIYLQHLLPYLAGEAIDVVLIDNESSDGTLEAVASGIFQNVVHVEHLPYKGFFDLSQQLQVKEKLSSICDADWVIHQDADEFLTSPSGWGGLRENIEQADAMGFNVVNFNELVMLPDNPEIDDFSTNNRLFYFFEPRPLRLMRAWKRNAGLSNNHSGGHILAGEDLCIWPQRMLLKHFIVRSQEHAYQKYLGRTFSADDMARGWHGNRLSFTRDNLQIPAFGPSLFRLATPQSAPARLPLPAISHFWEWPR